MDKWLVNGSKQIENKKKWTIKKFGEKILRSSEAVVHSCSTGYQFWDPKKFQKKFLSSWRSFLKIIKHLLHKSTKKAWCENRNQERKYDLWFSLPGMKVTLKQQSETVQKNSCR